MAAFDRPSLIYLGGATLSYAGTALVPVALTFAVLSTRHGGTDLGLVLAAQIIPTIILLLLGGVLGDRWSRRGIMIGCDLLRMLAQAILAGCLIEGHGSLALMVAVSGIIGIGNAFFGPASGGFLAEIVPAELLGRANGLLRTGNALAMVVGPAVGGVVVVAVGPGWGLAIDAGSYLASACCLLAIGRPAGPGSSVAGHGSVGDELLAAVRAVRRTRWIGMVIIQYGLLTMLAIAPFNVIVPVVLSRTPAGAGGWGTLLSAIGVGAVLGAVACARHQPRRMLLGVEVAAIMLSVPMFMLAAHAPFPVVVLGCVVYGVGAAMLSVLTITAIQKEVPHSMLSRIMAMVQLASMGPAPLGYVLAGPALGLLGPTRCQAVSGLCVVASVVIMLAQRDVRHFQCLSSQA